MPAQQDKPIMGLKTTKDFITQNAVENIMSVPKKAEKNFVDTRGGNKQPLEPSGLEPVYVHRKVGNRMFKISNFINTNVLYILQELLPCMSMESFRS